MTRRIRRGGNSEDFQLMFLGDVDTGGDGSTVVDGNALIWNEDQEKFLPADPVVATGLTSGIVDALNAAANPSTANPFTLRTAMITAPVQASEQGQFVIANSYGGRASVDYDGAGDIWSYNNGDPGVLGQEAYNALWHGGKPLPRVLIRRNELDSNGARDFYIVPYQYGMAVTYAGVIESYSRSWSFHNNLEGFVGTDGAHVWVGNDVDSGGLHFRARDTGGVKSTEIICEKFDYSTHGNMRFTVRAAADAFIWRQGAMDSEVSKMELVGGNLGIGITPVSNLHVSRAGNANVTAATEGAGSMAYYELTAPSAIMQLYVFGGSFGTSGRYIAAGTLLDSNGAGGLSLNSTHAIKLWTAATLRATLDTTKLTLTGIDLVFSANTVGPILVDRTDGHTYRIKVTAGVLGTEQVT